MRIKIEKIKFRNLLSYGNSFTEFEFKSGLNLIKAQNGSGKSAIIDAISFALFGKPYRNIKMMQLINNINDKDLEVVINFSDDNDSYEMGRGLKPNKFWLKKNGENLELLSSKRLNQDEINKIIGIDFEMFKNIVCVATTYNKSFLSCNPYEKRTLVENIFNINVLAEMLKEVKKRNTVNKTKQKTELATYNGLVDNLTTTTKFYKDVSAKLKSFNADKNAKILAKRADIDGYADELLTHEKNIKIGEQKIVEFEEKVKDKETVDDTIHKAKTDIMLAEAKIKDIDAKLKKLSTATCPICGSDLCSGHPLEYKKQLIEEKASEEQKVTESKNIITEFGTRKSDIDKFSDLIEKIKLKLVGERHKKTTLTETIKKTEDDIVELGKSSFTVDVEQYKSKITELEERKKALKLELDEIEKTIIMDEHLIRILGDNGVRVYFFDKLLPVLNGKVNYYLNKFELPLSFEFDNMLNAKITRGRYEMSYEQFSCGEKQRIDMSILLSFFDISKSISNWSCSVLFLDEVLDSGVDGSGLANFLSVLNNIVHEENEDDTGIYLISHKLQDSNIDFDSIVEITKKQLFSEIKVTE